MQCNFLIILDDRAGNVSAVSLPEDAHPDFSPTCAHETGKSDNLTFPQVK